MTQDSFRRAITLYDRFTHEGMDRRRFMSELTAIAGGAAAATALLSAIAADPAAAALTAPDDPAITTHRVQWRTGPGQVAKASSPAGKDATGGKAGQPVKQTVVQDRVLNGYLAAPAGAPAPLPGVIVVHENRGLNDYIEDVARRLALAGFFAVAPDFLTPSGGTRPTRMPHARRLRRWIRRAQSPMQWRRSTGCGTVRAPRARSPSSASAGAAGWSTASRRRAPG